MALTERSGSGFIVGGVTDTTPDWLGSYNEGYDAAQQQKTTALNQQEARQRMGLAAAQEQRLAARFADEQADRAAALEAARLGAQMPSEVPFDATPGAGLMAPYQVPVAPEPRAPSDKYAGELTQPISRDQFAQLLPEMTRLEQAEGLPNNYLETISMLESSGGANMGTGEKFIGIFQIGPEVAADFGVTPEQLKDPRVNAQVAAKLAARNAKIIRARLNREPQPWELYLAHQQGAGGAASLLQNPSMNVVDVMTNVYGGDRERARQAVIQNGGREDMTAAEFAGLWAQKFGGALPQQPQQAGVLTASGPSITGPSDFPSYEVNPQGSPIGEYYRKAGADAARQSALQLIEGQLSWDASSSPIMDLGRDIFGTVAGKEQFAANKAQNATALEWYRAPNVRDWLLANPQALTAASKDPLVFYNQYKDQLAAAPSAQTQPAAPATPGLQTQPTTPVAGAPAAPATPGLQTQPPPAAPAPPTQLNLAPIAARDLIPSTSAADYAGVNDGTGSLASSIARTRTGEVPKTPDTGMYVVEPAMIANERRLLAAQRSEIQRQLQMASMARDLPTIYKLRDQAAQNQLANNLMGAMEVIATMQQGDDEQFAQTLSGLTQGKQRLQPRSDGAFNVYYDNRLVGEGISRNQIIASLRMQYDQQYQALAAAQAKVAGERDLELFKNELKIREQVTTEEAKMYANTAAKRDELAIKNANPEYNITVGDDGTVTAVPKTGNPTPIRFEPQPILDPDGEPVLDGEGNPRYKLVPMPVQGR